MRMVGTIARSLLVLRSTRSVCTKASVVGVFSENVKSLACTTVICRHRPFSKPATIVFCPLVHPLRPGCVTGVRGPKTIGKEGQRRCQAQHHRGRRARVWSEPRRSSRHHSVGRRAHAGDDRVCGRRRIRRCTIRCLFLFVRLFAFVTCIVYVGFEAVDQLVWFSIPLAVG